MNVLSNSRKFVHTVFSNSEAIVKFDMNALIQFYFSCNEGITHCAYCVKSVIQLNLFSCGHNLLDDIFNLTFYTKRIVFIKFPFKF